jgi:hypothetical protein
MKDNENSERELVLFDAEAVSILQSIFNCSGEPAIEEGFSKTASVKFMITMQDEKGLRDLGYSQAQIDKIKPQEAEDILKRCDFKCEPC